MTEQKHLIKRQLIEVQVPPRANAQAVQAEVSRIYRQRIAPLIDQVCTALSTPAQRHRIDRLEVDLGVIPVERLEAELVAQTSRALHQALTAAIRAQPQEGDRPEPPTAVQAQLEILAHFARTGSLPWLVDASQPRLLEECLRGLYQQTPAALRTLVQTLVREPRPRQRLILHFGDEQLAALAALLAPMYATALTQDPPAWVVLWADAHLRQQLWDTLLQVAALGGSAYPTLTAFYQAVLRRVATAGGVAYRVLLTDLQQRAAATPAVAGSDCTATLANLLSAAPLAPSPPASPTNITLAQQVVQLQATGGVLSDLWRLLERLLPYLSPPGQAALLAALPPPEAARVVTMAAMQARIHQPLHLLLADPHLPSALRDELHQWLRRPTATVDPPAPAAPDAMGLRGGDELYIHNAGLVLLWPFLSHFFAHLGLLAGKAFKDEAAQQRGVGLLQALVSAEASWPEYHLPLNKLLCGLELDAVFAFGPPLLASEAEECDQLLNAVIAQAPILHAMTPDGFRATFLQRAGILRAQDGAWLLRVERVTYDIVLERFPWRWDWVKLPWMDAPLRVEWGEEVFQE